MLNRRLHKAGGDDGYDCGWKFKGAFHKPWYDCILENWGISKRVDVNKEIIDELVSKRNSKKSNIYVWIVLRRY